MSRWIRRVAFGVPILGVLAAAGCGGKVVNPPRVESFIRDHARPNLVLQSVSCPSGVPAKVGNSFVCKIAAAGGIKGTLRLHITSVQGTTLGLRFEFSDFHQTPPIPPTPARVKSTDVAAAAIGVPAFTTVIPPGFIEPVVLPVVPNDLLFVAVGPTLDSFTSNVYVVRPSGLPAVQVVDATLVRQYLQSVRSRDSQAHGFTSPTALKVGGDRAMSVDYASGSAQFRQVLVADGGYLYVITYGAAPGAFAGNVGALDDVIRSWQWG